jgi:hypothetical protein
MRRRCSERQFTSLAFVAWSLVPWTFVGCSGRSGGLPAPDVDSAAASAAALERYDANGDGALDAGELEACPPLASSRSTFDSNNDGRLTGDEIANRLNALAGPKSAFVSVNCTVTFSGVPLAGAKVTLRPPEFLGDSLPTAEATTDDSGYASPSISAESLPPQLKETPLVYPGLYRVEITHPERQLPSRYNSESELGIEIDPSSRSATSARFDLKP